MIHMIWMLPNPVNSFEFGPENCNLSVISLIFHEQYHCVSLTLVFLKIKVSPEIWLVWSLLYLTSWFHIDKFSYELGYIVPCSTGLYCVAVVNFWVFGRAEQISIAMPEPPAESRNEGEAEEEQRSPLRNWAFGDNIRRCMINSLLNRIRDVQ